ncbi:MAG: Mrp/NBP35 family ATP-binding protein [archaeon]
MPITLEEVSERKREEPQKKVPQNPFQQQRNSAEENLSRVKRVVAVHSGKGGVGKSTFCANLAATLAKMGFKTGVLDADVDCPSCHKLFGLKERVAADKAGRMIPKEAFGVKVLSVGNLVDDEAKANVMRGPIMFKLINDMLSNAEWGELDYLIIDLPPGTGDNPLTIMQVAPLNGLIIVTQPQELAFADAKKSVDMAKKLNVQVLGLAENMSGEIFGSRGEKLSDELGVGFLGSIPLDAKIRKASDEGKPFVLADEKLFELFRQIVYEAGL